MSRFQDRESREIGAEDAGYGRVDCADGSEGACLGGGMVVSAERSAAQLLKPNGSAPFQELEVALDALSVFDTRRGIDGLTESELPTH